MNKLSLKKVLLLLCVWASVYVGSTAPKAYAQKATIDTGFNIASRYIFRGVMLDDAPQVQMKLGVTYRNFAFYGWASHAIGRHDGNYREVRFWFNYSQDIGSLRITPQIENFYNANARMFDLHYLTTGHVFQGSVKLEGVRKSAPEFIIGYTFGTPVEETYYVEGAYRINTGDVVVRPFLSVQYSDGPGFMDMGYNSNIVFNQIGVNVSRQITVTESLMVPLTVSFILNPFTEKIYASVVIGI